MNSLPFWEDKCWGRVMHCFSSDLASVSYLEVEAGYKCSRHWHVDRLNEFIVISGKIIVEQWVTHKGTNKNVMLLLSNSDTCSIPAGALHRFRVVESGVVIEVYSPAYQQSKVNINDIERIDVGGTDVTGKEILRELDKWSITTSINRNKDSCQIP